MRKARLNYVTGIYLILRSQKWLIRRAHMGHIILQALPVAHVSVIQELSLANLYKNGHNKYIIEEFS